MLSAYVTNVEAGAQHVPGVESGSPMPAIRLLLATRVSRSIKVDDG